MNSSTSESRLLTRSKNLVMGLLRRKRGGADTSYPTLDGRLKMIYDLAVTTADEMSQQLEPVHIFFAVVRSVETAEPEISDGLKLSSSTIGLWAEAHGRPAVLLSTQAKPTKTANDLLGMLSLPVTRQETPEQFWRRMLQLCMDLDQVVECISDLGFEPDTLEQ